MPRLRISAVINVPIEEIYEYVTAFRRNEPIDEEDFQQKHGEIVSRERNVFMTMEEESVQDGTPAVRWRCTFEYPIRRVMEAIDSLWANRTDTFRMVHGGTHWSIEWMSKTGGLKGLLQLIYFKLRSRHIYYSRFILPTLEHFREKSSSR